MEVHIEKHRPASRPRCRHRRRVAEILVGDDRRLCAEAYNDPNNGDVVGIWPEKYKGRNWRQVGRVLPMPARALELIIEGYWNGTVAPLSAHAEMENGNGKAK